MGSVYKSAATSVMRTNESENPGSGFLPGTEPTVISWEDTLLGCLSMLSASEFALGAVVLGVSGCICVGGCIGLEYFPGTGAEYFLGALGAFLGVFIGIALAVSVVGALIGWLVGWGLWRMVQELLEIDCDPAFWWPIYIGAAIGGMIGLVWAIQSAVNTVRWRKQQQLHTNTHQKCTRSIEDSAKPQSDFHLVAKELCP